MKKENAEHEKIENLENLENYLVILESELLQTYSEIGKKILEMVDEDNKQVCKLVDKIVIAKKEIIKLKDENVVNKCNIKSKKEKTNNE